MAGLTIRTVARKAGVNIDTLRFCERQGVIVKPPRTDSNYRMYPEETVSRIRFVKRAQELGFSLKEINGLLALRATRGARCEDVRQQALEKIKIRSLRAMKTALGKLVAECASTRGPISDCPILESLNENGRKR